MHNFNVGDIVIYKKENKKNLYCVDMVYESYCVIQGINYRIIREVKYDDIDKATENDIDKEDDKTKQYHNEIIRSLERNKNNYVLGKILHIDGDDKYLKKCLELYRELGIYAYGVQVDEENIYKDISKFMYEVNPDVVVITGHDFFEGNDIKDLKKYKNTSHFIRAIKEVRKENQFVCIIAGACQSNFEALIAHGADFASSPARINIHVYDPAIIAIKVATTSFRQLVDGASLYKYIENGRKAFGGVQTVGKMKVII